MSHKYTTIIQQKKRKSKQVKFIVSVISNVSNKSKEHAKYTVFIGYFRNTTKYYNNYKN